MTSSFSYAKDSPDKLGITLQKGESVMLCRRGMRSLNQELLSTNGFTTYTYSSGGSEESVLVERPFRVVATLIDNREYCAVVEKLK
jgi:hypothetical protein